MGMDEICVFCMIPMCSTLVSVGALDRLLCGGLQKSLRDLALDTALDPALDRPNHGSQWGAQWVAPRKCRKVGLPRHGVKGRAA